MPSPLPFGLIGRINSAQFTHFADHVPAGTEPALTGGDGRTALEIALAARKSVETKSPVLLQRVPA